MTEYIIYEKGTDNLELFTRVLETETENAFYDSDGSRIVDPKQFYGTEEEACLCSDRTAGLKNFYGKVLLFEEQYWDGYKYSITECISDGIKFLKDLMVFEGNLENSPILDRIESTILGVSFVDACIIHADEYWGYSLPPTRLVWDCFKANLRFVLKQNETIPFQERELAEKVLAEIEIGKEESEKLV